MELLVVGLVVLDLPVLCRQVVGMPVVDKPVLDTPVVVEEDYVVHLREMDQVNRPIHRDCS